MKVFFTYEEGQYVKLLVDPSIKWDELAKVLAKKLNISPSQIKLHKLHKGKNTWVVMTKANYSLKHLDQLKVEKVTYRCVCIQLATLSKWWIHTTHSTYSFTLLADNKSHITMYLRLLLCRISFCV